VPYSGHLCQEENQVYLVIIIKLSEIRSYYGTKKTKNIIDQFAITH